MAECTIWYMFHLVQRRGQMAQLHVEAEGVAHAAPEAVWELVANADSYQRWGPWSGSGYQSPGDHADGPGVIRWMRYGRTTTVEKVLEAEKGRRLRSEEHTSELQSLTNLVCRLLLEKKKEEALDI